MTYEELKEAVQAYYRGSSKLPAINSWDVSNITNFAKLFANLTSFNDDTNGWETS